MRVVILGGGLAGLAAADKLANSGKAEILILEKAPFLGGLASSFEIDGHLIPRFNHHIVRTNTKTLEYLRRYDLLGDNKWKRINLAVAVESKVYNINNPLKFARFKYLSFLEKLRFGLFGIYVSYILNPDSLPDDLNAETYLNKMCGKSVTQKIYYQLYGRNKFNIPLSQISMKQFAHRMKEREFNDLFTYPAKGLQGLVDGLEKDLRRKNCRIHLKVTINDLDVESKIVKFTVDGRKYAEQFDTLINTIPVPELVKFAKGLPASYVNSIKKLRYVPVVGLLIGTESFLDSKNYWVNFIGERVHVLYQHSLLVDKYASKVSWCVRYGGSEEDLLKSDKEIKDLYVTVLEKYFPTMKIKWCFVFKERYAEPVYDKEYKQYAPTYRTPIKGFYNAGIQVTFPKIRNINVALESGEKVAEIVLLDLK
jgi:protoporphyrinogen oxidase